MNTAHLYRVEMTIRIKRDEDPRTDHFVVGADTPVMDLEFWTLACAQDATLLDDPYLWIELEREQLDAEQVVVLLELVTL